MLRATGPRTSNHPLLRWTNTKSGATFQHDCQILQVQLRASAPVAEALPPWQGEGGLEGPELDLKIPPCFILLHFQALEHDTLKHYTSYYEFCSMVALLSNATLPTLGPPHRPFGLIPYPPPLFFHHLYLLLLHFELSVPTYKCLGHF